MNTGRNGWKRGLQALGLAVGIAGLGGASDAFAADLSGVYCARGGDDILIVDDHGSRLGFELSSWQGGMHHCGTGRLTAARQGNGYTVSDGACTLRLGSDGTDMVLEAAPFEACKRQYCGARAALSTLRLPLASRRALPLPFDSISMMETPLCR